MNSTINVIAAIIMTILVSRHLPNRVYPKNIASTIVATIVFIVNFLICSILGNHNNILDYYTYLQLSIVVSRLVYYNLI